MSNNQFSESALINAPAEKVYNIIADYNDGHPRILPKPPFVSLAVRKGGIGAGTIIKAEMKVMGKVQAFQAVITEPDPGRVLVETNDDGYATSFIVEPREGGKRCYVTIATEMNGRSGLLGKLEKWFVSRMLRPVYVKELEQLEEVALGNR